MTFLSHLLDCSNQDLINPSPQHTYFFSKNILANTKPFGYIVTYKKVQLRPAPPPPPEFA